uniref:Aldehyde ferredoxin oxidoreductase N-terminal domain-containing protein n=1 Tax=Panagrolaimus davidi TaxID=227884 RepID=A0A914PVX5_9BILA
MDVQQSQNIVIRYLYSEKLGTGGYFTRSLVKIKDGKEIVMKENVVSGYVRGMLLACFLADGLGKKEKNESALIVGLGGGAMNNFFSTLENQVCFRYESLIKLKLGLVGGKFTEG